MTNKEQINEFDIAIRNIVKNNFVKVPSYSRYGGFLCNTDMSTSSIAEALYNVGYRKVGKNAVVLTAEKIAEFETACRKAWCEAWDKSRAKTTKEIFSKLREKSAESFLDWEGNIRHLDEEYVSMREIKAVLKQLDVEVE